MKWIARILTKWLLCLTLLGTTVCWSWDEPEVTRPQLQIINGSSQDLDVFWMKTDNERIENGSVAPGKNVILQTTIGHRFLVVGREDKTEVTVTSEVPIQAFRFD